MARRLVSTLLLAALALAGCSSGRMSNWTYAPAASPGPSVVAVASQSSAAPGGAVVGTIKIESFDLGFSPNTVTVQAPGRYTVTLKNTGQMTHDVTFASGEKVVAAAGETATLEVAIPAAGLTFICSIPGHAQSGMTGTVAVSTGTAAASPGAASPAPASAPADDHGGPLPATTIAADPKAPAPVTHDAVAPARLEGAVHDIDLVMTEQLMTVAPGFVQKVWTFNGTVPGPVIRVKVGDKVRIHLKNPIENQMSHSIDFHASQVAWNDEMRSIAPGQELLYEWTAAYAGVWMYHCGTAPALQHIANGMFGMVIVEPKAGLPPVDREFALVQNEWYLGPQGQPIDLAKASAAVPAPDFVTFNGVANQYKDAPLQVTTGERVRIFVLDAGPSVDSSFHIVGTIFDTVTKEGLTLQRGNAGNWASQAVDLSPAQGAIVEFKTAEDGLYPIVTHAFNFVGRGALGLIKSGDGDPTN